MKTFALLTRPALVFLILNSSFLISSSAQTPVFYGMTSLGGSNYHGAIISFNPDTRQEKMLWSFGSGTDGTGPYGNFVADTINELFYGPTAYGGTTGNGTIITFNPANDSEKVAWNFGTGTDGQNPIDNLIWDANTSLFYSNTPFGGSGGLGTIFSFNPANDSEKVLWNFQGPDGGWPEGDLVPYTGNGLFYELTAVGGGYGMGTIITFNPANDSEKVVWNFGNGVDGNNPEGNMVFDTTNGSFYGITVQGGSKDSGTIFSFNPTTDSEKVVWNFSGGGIDGVYPVKNLIWDAGSGLFYGTTLEGGSNFAGVIFSFNPVTNSEKVVWNFGSGADGKQPESGLVFDAEYRFFYGTTSAGGSQDSGAIIVFNPATNAENVVWNFGSGTDGAAPYGPLLLYPPVATEGINDISDAPTSIIIFPNPTGGKLEVGGWKLELVRIEVYNYLGQKVLQLQTQNTKQEVDLSSLANGIYLVRVLDVEENVVGERKVVKQ